MARRGPGSGRPRFVFLSATCCTAATSACGRTGTATTATRANDHDKRIARNHYGRRVDDVAVVRHKFERRDDRACNRQRGIKRNNVGYSECIGDVHRDCYGSGG